jgi:hypothetical protein
MIGVGPDEFFIHADDLNKDAGAFRINDIVAVGIPRRENRVSDFKVLGGAGTDQCFEKKEERLQQRSKRGSWVFAGNADDSGMKRSAKFTTPEVEGQWGQTMVFARQAVVAEPIRNDVEGQGLQPIQRSLNDFFGVAVKLGDEGRQQGKRMATSGTKQASDRNRIRVGQSDQLTDVAPVPAQVTLLLADPALRRFGKPLFLKRPKVIVDFGFEQRNTVASLSQADNDRPVETSVMGCRFRFGVSCQQNKTTIFGQPLLARRQYPEQPIVGYRLARARLECPKCMNLFLTSRIEHRCKNIGVVAPPAILQDGQRHRHTQREDEPMYRTSHSQSENKKTLPQGTMISWHECSALGRKWPGFEAIERRKR